MFKFLGDSESTLDAKGRFLFPTIFKKKLPEEQNSSFVIKRGYDECLDLYPVQNWDITSEKITALNEFDSKDREFRRFFLNGANPVELDGAGRLLIPKTLITYAGLEKDIVLIAVLEKIEIWSKVKHEKFLNSFSEERFNRLSDEVMAKNKLNG